MSDEITVTLTSLEQQKTESISVSRSSTTLSELCEFAVALLGINDGNGNGNGNGNSSGSGSGGVVLTKDGKRLYASSNNGAHSQSQSQSQSQSLASVGIQNGDLIVVVSSSTMNATTTTTATNNRTAPRSNASASVTASAGGLDFSSLLSGLSSNSTPASASASASTSGGLTFNFPPALPMFSQTVPVQYPGISLDDCIARNTNPECFIRVLLSPQHPNLIKELNYHSPTLATRLKTAYRNGNGNGNGNVTAATKIWREHIQKGTMNSTLSKTLSQQKEHQMTQRLRSNPMDVQANEYFSNKIRQQNVEEQYTRMMNENPESMGKVLMLYIDAEVNGHSIAAFVDSGAQSTIMSSKCAERCGLLHLLDTRFEGVAVGVGTGKILGRVHVAEMKVQGIGHIFPCTITIMDSEKGLGDQNMDFLLGLDMLKRHKCNIDLGKNVLVFSVGGGKMETPFLHEKDLSESKGGTKGFDAAKSNQELEDRVKMLSEKKDDDNGNGNSDDNNKPDEVMKE